ncbi:hypothetical protein [Spiroplasma endosymbiont of Acasis viretata]|uniref:hypothetical protein n=1 Tax=Spiroplasma endosymbiont of Acasis viretata TaxID=3066306 RepID=UPI00313E22D6
MAIKKSLNKVEIKIRKKRQRLNLFKENIVSLVKEINSINILGAKPLILII